jgi:CMP/dCMP kinase
MKITISGIIGSGKTTIADELAKRLGYNRYSSGEFMREMADKERITLLELSKRAETDFSIDKKIDDRQILLGKTEDNFVIDGRLSWKFISDSVKIYLDVSDEEAARRIFNDPKEIRKKEKFSSLDELVQQMKKRRVCEIERYEKYYKVNIHDRKNYDIYLDTTGKTIEEEVNYLMKKIGELNKK